VAESLERSLANLRVDRIDSLLLHSPMDTLDQTLVVWRQFEIAVDAGKVAGLGRPALLKPEAHSAACWG
jgi:diketogulonate reductase-like aldo/keto reductase